MACFCSAAHRMAEVPASLMVESGHHGRGSRCLHIKNTLCTIMEYLCICCCIWVGHATRLQVAHHMCSTCVLMAACVLVWELCCPIICCKWPGMPHSCPAVLSVRVPAVHSLVSLFHWFLHVNVARAVQFVLFPRFKTPAACSHHAFVEQQLCHICR